MIQELRPALILVLLMTALTGLIYPLTMTGIAQVAFPTAANGSLIVQDGKVIGSELIAQNFTRPEYFHPRPSAVKYDASNSGGSNAAPSSKDFIATITQRVNTLRAELHDRQVPIELVTTSGSGLDPHLSYQAADVQVERIAKARGLKEGDIETLIINPLIEDRTFSFLGERRVNILKLNLALDAFRKNNTKPK